MLPNFLCIGAQKSGTTSIWQLLNAHPDVFLASPRETQFFSDELKFANGLQFYESQHFAVWKDQSAVGEKCPEYLCVPEAAVRIRSSLGPNVKFVVTLRNPAQRAFSHYRHNLLAMRETRRFEDAIADEINQMNDGQNIAPPFGYVSRRQYAQQLKRYLKQFDIAQFLFVCFEQDVCSDQRALAHRLCGFLNIQRILPPGLPFRSGRPKLDELFVQIDQSSKNEQDHFVEWNRNRPRSAVRRVVDRLMTRSEDSGRRVYRPSEALLQWAENIIHYQTSATGLTKEFESSLNHEVFRNDIQELQRLTSLDLSHWLIDSGHAGVQSTSRAA